MSPTSIPTIAASDNLRDLELALERERVARQDAEREVDDLRRRARMTDERWISERNAELDQAIATTKSAIASKVDLLGLLAHEVLTPVHVLRGVLELLQARPMDSTSSGLLEAASSATASLERLFRNAVVITDADQRPPAFSPPITLAVVLSAAAGRWRMAAAAQGALMLVEDRSAGMRLITDRGLLDHALDELLHNAVRHGAGGVIRIVGTGAGDIAMISIIDEGGQSSSDIGAYLLPDGEQHLTGPGPGPGLGLRVANRLAKRLGGSLTYERVANATELTVRVRQSPV